jgi:3-hydroxyisobutyrate dehydrogenase
MHDKDVVFTCLPSALESGSIIRKLANESTLPKTFIDLTSGCFEQSREIAQDIQPHTYIDAPISGGPRGAAAGTLTSMLGVKSIEPDIQELVEIYSKKIICCGGVGNGNAIKSVNNYLNVSHLMLASDALLGLKKQGVDPVIALKAINSSSGRSLQTQERIPNDVLTEKFNYGFKLNLMSKDVLNAAPILKDGPFFECMSQVLTPHSFCEEDYTYIAKFIEIHHNVKF